MHMAVSAGGHAPAVTFSTSIPRPRPWLKNYKESYVASYSAIILYCKNQSNTKSYHIKYLNGLGAALMGRTRAL